MERATGRGFTLVELIVVITIIGLLITLLSPVLSRLLLKGETSVAENEIQHIKIALKAYETEMGDLPPTSSDEMGVIPPNPFNLGIESLVLAFHRKDYGGVNPFTEMGDRSTNTDGDSASANITVFDTLELFEYADPWGNPYVYFRLRDCQGTLRVQKVMCYTADGDEDASDVEAVKLARLGVFAGREDGFQVISFGPDGEFGTDDDVTSW